MSVAELETGKTKSLRPSTQTKSQSNVIFVTGTDTNVGKSVVTAWLAAQVPHHYRIALIKAIQTDGRSDSLLDATVYRSLLHSKPVTVETLVELVEPLAPAIAARRAGTQIKLTTLVDQIRSTSSNHDLTIVEGSGGLLVPIDDCGHDFRDLAILIGARVVVVVKPQLGTINHTLLTLEAATAHGIRPVLIVCNGVRKSPGVVETENIAFFRRCIPKIPLLTLHRADESEIHNLKLGPRLYTMENERGSSGSKVLPALLCILGLDTALTEGPHRIS